MGIFLVFLLITNLYFFFTTYFKIQKEKFNSLLDYVLLSLSFSGVVYSVLTIIWDHLKMY